MYRVLIANKNKIIDAENYVLNKLKRGTFVKLEYDDTYKQNVLVPATSEDDMLGILTRDTKETYEVALGYDIDPFDEEQDIVVGLEDGTENNPAERAGYEVPEKGEKFSTTEYDTNLTDDDVIGKDKYLAIDNGILKASSTATGIVADGWRNDANMNRMLAYRFI